MKVIRLLIFFFWVFSFLACASRRLQSSGPNSGLKMGTVVTIHSESGFRAPCEPSIAINPRNTQEMVAGSVLDNLYLSTNGGMTWTIGKMSSSLGVYGDPVIRYTGDGGILYAHLSNPEGKAYRAASFLDRIVVQRSLDGGISWNDGSFPPADLQKDHDKHWLCTGLNGTVLMSWTEFDKYGDTSTNCHSRILFSASQDGGVSWSNAKSISLLEGNCEDDDQTAEGAYPCIGSDGRYYVVWGRDGGIWVNESRDEGVNWLPEEQKVAQQHGGWAMDIPGIGRCNGMPVMKCDLSGGPYHGRLYILWADQRFGKHDTDIWLIYSDSKGERWSEPVRVNDGPRGKHQFFPWMDIDQATGRLYVVFYDRRKTKGTNTDVFLATSLDGGQNFTNMRISTSSFKSEKTVFFGDYNDISAYNRVIRPIWTRQDGDRLSIQTAIIEDDEK
jgi:hypothetical protein